MRNSIETNSPTRRTPNSDRAIAIAIAFSILICLAAFAWIFVQLEPLMDDFTGTDVVVTPEVVDPGATPNAGGGNVDADAAP